MAVLPPDPVFSLRCSDMGPVNSLCFHQNERLLAGTIKGSIHLWDLQTNRSSLHFDVGPNPVTALYHTDDHLLSQEKGGAIKHWSMSNTGYILENSLEGNHPAFCRPDFVPDQNLLLMPKDENSICVISMHDFQILHTLIPSSQINFGHVSCIKGFHAGGQLYILAGYESGHLLTWDIRCSKVINQEKFEEILMAVDYDPDTNCGVCGGPGDKIEVFSYQRQSMELLKRCEIGIKNPGINCLRIRPDRKIFASGGWDGRVRIFSWKSLRPLAVLTEHKNGGIMDIAYSSGKVSMWNAPIMAAGGVDAQITLWDLYN